MVRGQIDTIPSDVTEVADIQFNGQRTVGGGDRPMPKEERLPDGEWYGKLVDYHLKRRAIHEGFWREVDQHVWDKRKEWEHIYGNAQQIGLVKTGRIKAFVDQVVASVFIRDPAMSVREFNALMDSNMEIMVTQAMNNEWGKTNKLRRQARLVVKDTAKYGYGVMMTSFVGKAAVSATRQRENRRRFADGGIVAGLQDVVETELAVDAVMRGGDHAKVTSELDSDVMRRRVVSRRLSPFRFVCDPDAWGLPAARWMGREFTVHLDALKADPAYDQEAVKHVKPSKFTERDYARHFVGKADDDPYDRVMLYEIFERQADGRWRMVVFQKGSRTLLREKMDIYAIGAPYAMLRWDEDGEEMFAQPDVLNAWRLYLSETLLLTKMLQTDSRRMADLLFVDEAAGVTEEVIQAAIQGRNSGIIPVKKMGQKPANSMFFQPTTSSGSGETLQILQLMERGFQIASGLGPNQMSQALKSETSATEAEQIALQSQARGSHRVAAFEEFVSDVALQRLGLMCQFYGKEDIVRLVGPDMAQHWKSFWTPADIRDGLEVQVTPGSTRPDSPAVRLQQLQSLVQGFSGHPILASIVDYPKFGELAERYIGVDPSDSIIIKRDSAEVSDAVAELGIQQLAGGRQQGSAAAPRTPPANAARANQAAQGGP